MKRVSILFAAAFLLASPSAQACSLGLGPPFPELVKSERSVFVFQLETLAVVGKGPEYHEASGRIRVLRTLKGPPASFRYARVPIVSCGLQLHVGEPYVMATSQDGKVLNLFTSGKPLLELGMQYLASASDQRNDRGAILTEIRHILATGKESADFPRSEYNHRWPYHPPPPLPRPIR